MDMKLDIPYGRLPIQERVLRLIRVAQEAPKNWFGQQLSQLCRKLVIRTASFPIDVEVEGIRIRALLSDNNSEKKYIFMPWRFDQKERSLLAEMVPPDGVFVDIGANIGIYSLWMAKHMSNAGRVVAFEPNPPAFDRLRFNVLANSEKRQSEWPEVTCVQKGVSDASGTFSLYLDPDNLGGSSLVMHEAMGKKVVVECVTLIQQLQDLQVDHIDALKIDIEGAEDRALIPFLEAAPRELLPRLIVLERTHQDEKTGIDDALGNAGYRVLALTKMNAVYALD